MTEVVSIDKKLLHKFNASSIIDAIGMTPLVEIKNIPEQHGVTYPIKIYAKAEWMNPGGSVKDRAAKNIILEGITSGLLNHHKTILDASSGNTGIALAMIGANIGLAVRICIPANASPERLGILRAYGADLILTNPLEGMDGAILKAQEILTESPKEYFYTNQYSNPANWKAHYNTTAVEIINQTNYQVTHFVSGLGTSGTFIGTSKRLKADLDTVQCVSFQPSSPLHGIEGLKHMETALKPGIYDPQFADSNIFVSTDEAQTMMRKIAQQEGLFVGISAGAALQAVIELAKQEKSGIFVTIFPDRGERYLTEDFWRN